MSKTSLPLAGLQLVYQLEANAVLPELSCFCSRAPFESEVLGFAYQVGYWVCVDVCGGRAGLQVQMHV